MMTEPEFRERLMQDLGLSELQINVVIPMAQGSIAKEVAYEQGLLLSVVRCRQRKARLKVKAGNQHQLGSIVWQAYMRFRGLE